MLMGKVRSAQLWSRLAFCGPVSAAGFGGVD